MQTKSRLRARDSDALDAFDESNDYHAEPNIADDLVQTKSHVRARDPADDIADESTEYHAEKVMNDDLIQQKTLDPADDIADESASDQAFHSEPNTADDLV